MKGFFENFAAKLRFRRVFDLPISKIFYIYFCPLLVHGHTDHYKKSELKRKVELPSLVISMVIFWHFVLRRNLTPFSLR